MGLGPTHESAVALDPIELNAAAAEDAIVRTDVLRIALLQTRLVHIERVGILHQELADTQDPALRPRLITELELDLVPGLRKVAVGAKFAGSQPGKDLLVGHRQHHVRGRPGP